MQLHLTVNGEARELEADPELPLLWLLREKLDLTGTKFGCGIGACGACTVLVDGEAVRACVLPAQAVAGRSVQTIEGLAATPLRAVQSAWLVHQVPQCGYCQSGMIMAAAGLLRRNPAPSAEQVREGITNLCRCGTYQRVERAVLEAAEVLARSDS